ncbi:protoporphyrinogen oxidase [Cohnella boryungensis]|uniref:Coproporphyrinogen III oxidase n=1 Tax=Cohnella boryungensis TaxID=768479 RepID=A0ABV8SFM6_9BACL
MRQSKRKVAVLGGGITGLSAAFYLQRLARERGEEIEVTVFEGSDRLGGRINTLRKNGFVIERGPDSFLARKLPMIQLARELGIEGELTGTNPQASKTYISREGELVPMPQGLTLGVPSDLEKFMATELVSEEGKLRALSEQGLSDEGDGRDESVGAFLERRMGKEMVERIFEPLLAGIHAGNLYKLGLKATFPQFKAMVETQGSLIAGTQEAQRAAAAAKEKAPVSTDAANSPALPTSVFMTFKNGLTTVVEALEDSIRKAGGSIRLGADVAAIELPEREGAPYKLRLSDGSEHETDQAVVALPAANIAKLLEPHTNVAALSDMTYVSVANVVFAYDEAGFNHDLDGSGFLVPRGENRKITASTWTSSKWGHTAPAGKRLVRCYVGRAGDEEGVELDDEAMAEAVRKDLLALMGLDAKPEFVEITRLRHSMPQYPVGHVEAISDFRAKLADRLPGVYATGAAFDAVGLPDCIAQGKQAAEALLALPVSS